MPLPVRPASVLARRSLLAAAVALASPVGALAQDAFPRRPVRIVVAWPPGGGTDIVARLLAEPMRESLGQPVIVDNRAGGGGNLGADVVAHAAPDGYTLLLTAGALAIAPSVRKDMTFDPVRDLTGVALLAAVPLFVVARPESPLQTVADVLALARQRGAQATYATAGHATPPHLIGERMSLQAANRMTHVPYRGSAQAMPDILSGVVDFAILDAVSAAPYISSGRLRALAINGTQRSPTFPNVPTLSESGVPFDAVGWHAAFAPAATPAAIVNRLNAALVAALALANVRQAIVTAGSLPIEPPLSSAAWTARFRQEVTAWGEVARAARIEAE